MIHLDNQVELVKVSLYPQSLEGITKLSSSFFQTHSRLSVSYIITAILFDSKKKAKPGLPVIKRIEPPIVEIIGDSKISSIAQNLLADTASRFCLIQSQ